MLPRPSLLRLLLSAAFAALLVTANFVAIEHDCHHPGEDSHDCTLCWISFSPAENADQPTLTPPAQPETLVSIPDLSPVRIEHPRSHSPRSPPSL